MRAFYKKPKVGQMLPATHQVREKEQHTPQLPNSLVMRVMQESGAEREAD